MNIVESLIFPAMNASEKIIEECYSQQNELNEQKEMLINSEKEVHKSVIELNSKRKEDFISPKSVF